MIEKLEVGAPGGHADRRSDPDHQELEQEEAGETKGAILQHLRTDADRRAAEAAMRETFGSTCHGAGRLMSRTAAVKAARGRTIGEELRQRGVLARATGRDALAEEMPEAYKDVQDVVDVVHRFGISTRVARLRPLAVIKG